MTLVFWNVNNLSTSHDRVERRRVYVILLLYSDTLFRRLRYSVFSRECNMNHQHIYELFLLKNRKLVYCKFTF